MCGIYHDAARDSERRHHAVGHDRVLNGVSFRSKDRFEVVDESGDLSFLLVRPDAPLIQRKRAERLSRTASQLPLEQGGYDLPPYFGDNPYQTPAELAPHVLLAARGTRLIAMVVFEWRPLTHTYHWNESERGYQLGDPLPYQEEWAFAHVWTIPRERGRGIGVRLVRRVAALTTVAPENLGWMTPISPSGVGLLRRVTPVRFLRAYGLPIRAAPKVRGSGALGADPRVHD